MKSLLFGIVAVLSFSGCAAFITHQKNEAGQEVVWIDAIYWERAPNTAASGAGAGFAHAAGMLGFGLVGQVVANLVGRSVSALVDDNVAPGKIYIGYYPDVPRPLMVGGIIGWRDAWPGAEKLLPNTWAIVSRDEKGMILLPCSQDCAPVQKRTSATSGAEPLADGARQ